MSATPPAMLLGGFTIGLLCAMETLLLISLLVSNLRSRRW